MMEEKLEKVRQLCVEAIQLKDWFDDVDVAVAGFAKEILSVLSGDKNT